MGIYDPNRKTIIWRIIINFLEWFFKKLKQSNSGVFEVGKMYIFRYDPKHKNTLKYYDTFPLVIVFKVMGDRFLGINLHYLPPDLRIQLLNKIASKSVIRDNKIVKYAITENDIKNQILFKPCIKEYLFNHVKSRFSLVDDDEWFTIPYLVEEEIYLNNVVTLEFEEFKKQSKQKVWNDSKKIIKKGR